VIWKLRGVLIGLFRCSFIFLTIFIDVHVDQT
jgi:hypothetical protein